MDRKSANILYLGDETEQGVVSAFQSREQADGSKEEVVIFAGDGQEQTVAFSALNRR